MYNNYLPTIYTLLSTDASFLTLIGGVNHLCEGWADSFKDLPMVTYEEIDNQATNFADNKEIGSAVVFKFEIFSNSSVQITNILTRLDALMNSIQWFRTGSCMSIYEPSIKLRRKIIEYHHFV